MRNPFAEFSDLPHKGAPCTGSEPARVTVTTEGSGYMTTVAVIEAWTAQLLDDPSRWPVGAPEVDLEDLTYQWAMDHALRQVDASESYTIERWISTMKHGPIPIGREAIAGHPVLKSFPRADREVLSRLAILPGREYLDIPIPCTVNGTFCELLLLRKRRTFRDGPLFMWLPTDLAFRITGYPQDPDVARLIQNARRWWSEKAQLPFPKGGRPRTEIEYDLACRLYLDHQRQMDVRPSYEDLAAALEELTGRPLSPKTLQRRVKDWRRQGPEWPPNLI
jgi:hypothetical protein